jgi:hypothetical protein
MSMDIDKLRSMVDGPVPSGVGDVIAALGACVHLPVVLDEAARVLEGDWKTFDDVEDRARAAFEAIGEDEPGRLARAIRTVPRRVDHERIVERMKAHARLMFMEQSVPTPRRGLVEAAVLRGDEEYRGMFAAPQFVRSAPMAEAVEWWNDAVRECAREGDLFEDDGTVCGRCIVKRWNSKVYDAYGFRGGLTHLAQVISEARLIAGRFMALQ